MHDKGLADRTKAIELNPKIPEAWFARGSAYYLLGDYGKAKSDIAEALKLRPDYQEAAEVMAKTEERLKEAKNVAPPPVARTVAPPGLVVPPPAPPAPPEPKTVAAPPEPKPVPPAPVKAAAPSISAQQHEARGRSFTQASKYSEAIEELTAAIQAKPDLATAYNARGYVYLLKRDYQHALADFNDAIRLNPTYANALQNRAIAQKALDKSARQPVNDVNR